MESVKVKGTALEITVAGSVRRSAFQACVILNLPPMTAQANVHNC